MRYCTFLFPLCLLIGCTVSGQPTITIGNTILEVDTIYTGLDVPWEIIYGPDGTLWITERKGLVSRIDPVAKTKTVMLDITSSVFRNSESGLLGMALHPDFDLTPEVFLVYTYKNGSNTRERLVKYTYVNDSLVNPDTLIDGILGNTTHDGSRLMFLPDKTLLMTTGDAQNQTTPQNLSAINGKVLRLNTDGSIPADNPFSGTYVYSYGHRNAQGLCMTPAGNIYISEHGPNNDDEFQLLLKGRNYGWPNVEGFCDKPAETTFCGANNVVEPLVAWTPTIAPSDIVYYENASFPEWDGCILMTVLKDLKIVALKLSSDGSSVTSQTHHLTGMFGRLRDICIGPSGDIFIATNGASWSNTDPNTHSIIRLKVQNTTSTKSLSVAQGISVYPNPAKGFIDVAYNSASYQVQLLDIYGRVCLTKSDMKGHDRIWLQGIPAGMYILRVLGSGIEAIQVRVAVEG